MEPLTPRLIRPVPPPLGAYFRAGWCDHHKLEQVVSEGRASLAGIVFDACNSERHRDLRDEARKARVEAVLDTRSMELATAGGLQTRAGRLPWAAQTPHSSEDLEGSAGLAMVESIADFTVRQQFTAVLAPSHLISSAADPWLEVDLRLTTRLRDLLNQAGRGRFRTVQVEATDREDRDPHPCPAGLHTRDRSLHEETSGGGLLRQPPGESKVWLSEHLLPPRSRRYAPYSFSTFPRAPARRSKSPQPRTRTHASGLLP